MADLEERIVLDVGDADEGFADFAKSGKGAFADVQKSTEALNASLKRMLASIEANNTALAQTQRTFSSFQGARGFTQSELAAARAGAIPNLPLPPLTPPPRPRPRPGEEPHVGGGHSVGAQFRHGIHAVEPGLRAFGADISALGGIAGAARGGVLVLAAAIGGALVGALANAALEAGKTANRFKQVYGAGGGPEQEARARKIADQLHVPIGNVAPGLEALHQAQGLEASSGFSFPETTRDPKTGKLVPYRPTQAQLDQAPLQTAQGQARFYGNLRKLLGQGGDVATSGEAANKILEGRADQLLKRPGTTSTLTAEQLETIRQQSPAAAARIAQQFGTTLPQLQGDVSTGARTIPFEEFAKAVNQLSEVAERAFRERPTTPGDIVNRGRRGLETTGEKPLPDPDLPPGARQQTPYERYQAARRLYAEGGSGVVPGTDVSGFKGGGDPVKEFSSAVSEFGSIIQRLGQKKAPSTEGGSAAPEGGQTPAPAAAPAPAQDKSPYYYYDQAGNLQVIQPHASGGEIDGDPGVDNILIGATKGEHVTPKDAASFYGPKMMEDIRTRRFPKPSGYQMGGFIGDTAGSSPSDNTPGTFGGDSSLPIQNHLLHIKVGNQEPVGPFHTNDARLLRQIDRAAVAENQSLIVTPSSAQD